MWYRLSPASKSIRLDFLFTDITARLTSKEPCSFPLQIWGKGRILSLRRQRPHVNIGHNGCQMILKIAHRSGYGENLATFKVLTSCWVLAYRRIPCSNTKYLWNEIKWAQAHSTATKRVFCLPHHSAHLMPASEGPLLLLHEETLTQAWNSHIVQRLHTCTHTCDILHYFPMARVLWRKPQLALKPAHFYMKGLQQPVM